MQPSARHLQGALLPRWLYIAQSQRTATSSQVELPSRTPDHPQLYDRTEGVMEIGQLAITGLVAALVSAVVTLVIEWLAKPKLEARKNRLLEKDNYWRRLLAVAKEKGFRHEDGTLYAVDTDKPDLVDEYRACRVYVEFPRNKADRQALRFLDDLMNGVPTRTEPDYWSVMLGCVAVLETPKWRWRKRKKAITELAQALHEAQLDYSNTFFSSAPTQWMLRRPWFTSDLTDWSCPKTRQTLPPCGTFVMQWARCSTAMPVPPSTRPPDAPGSHRS